MIMAVYQSHVTLPEDMTAPVVDWSAAVDQGVRLGLAFQENARAEERLALDTQSHIMEMELTRAQTKRAAAEADMAEQKSLEYGTREMVEQRKRLAEANTSQVEAVAENARLENFKLKEQNDVRKAGAELRQSKIYQEALFWAGQDTPEGRVEFTKRMRQIESVPRWARARTGILPKGELDKIYTDADKIQGTRYAVNPETGQISKVDGNYQGSYFTRAELSERDMLIAAGEEMPPLKDAAATRQRLQDFVQLRLSFPGWSDPQIANHLARNRRLTEIKQGIQVAYLEAAASPQMLEAISELAGQASATLAERKDQMSTIQIRKEVTGDDFSWWKNIKDFGFQKVFAVENAKISAGVLGETTAALGTQLLSENLLPKDRRDIMETVSLLNLVKNELNPSWGQMISRIRLGRKRGEEGALTIPGPLGLTISPKPEVFSIPEGTSPEKRKIISDMYYALKKNHDAAANLGFLEKDKRAALSIEDQIIMTDAFQKLIPSRIINQYSIDVPGIIQSFTAADKLDLASQMISVASSPNPTPMGTGNSSGSPLPILSPE